jgi:hydroxymethylglutaryl-CoA reductase (NADPH)
VEEKTSSGLSAIGSTGIDPETVRGNIENFIGTAQVPLGVAGPLLVNGDHARGIFYIPMATTEGALVRSYERGMAAISHSGGAQALVLEDENQTAPTFFFPTVREAREFALWLPEQQELLREECSASTRHGVLTSCRCHQVGRNVIANFGFGTGDAQGMNMIVRATDRLCRRACQEFGSGEFLLFSGMCSEKRASAFLMTRGKGKRATAGALLPNKVLRMVLHTTAEKLMQVWHSTVIGHLQAGAIGYNAHVANGLTAIFIATGQDVANVVNSSVAITSFDPCSEGLYVSVTLPALSIATVGGGTGLATQNEALAMLGCCGSGKATKLAEIITASVLAGEISMAAAIASHEFVAAHETYGRNRPKEAQDPPTK